ncbi:MAG: hypothetical protein CMJ90_18240 [Planctomycetes bacterium]|nr:hypothetical protein [Planctomycetota bacterium]
MNMTATLDILRIRLDSAEQGHVLGFWDRLDDEARAALLDDVASVDLEQLKALHRRSLDQEPTGPASVEALPQITKGADSQADADARRVGEQLLRDGKSCAFTVAGGQGTRLGHEGPKGTFPATPIQGKPLFQVFAEKLLVLERRFLQPVPWYVMTSPGNHDDTQSFFAQHDYFGLKSDHVMFFQQGTMPALTADGRLILESEHALFRSPDGHGGSLRALFESGAVADMETRGVEEIYYFQVDNPLVEMCDPVFMGYHRQRGSEFSSKSVPKRAPEEKVGILVLVDGKPGVIEYSDLADGLRNAREDSGLLRFRAGNIAVHAISRAFVERLNEGGFGLPMHIARKKIPAKQPDGAIASVDGIKFETFVFDALPLARKVLLMEVPRATEFAPIKNRDGSDSPETSWRAQSTQFADWLEAAGVVVPRDPDGSPQHRIEICPLFADSRQEVAQRRTELPDSIDADTMIA